MTLQRLPEGSGDSSAVRNISERVIANLRVVYVGQSVAIRKLLAAFLAGGHVLLEDVPGTGKTTLAKALAGSMDATFRRVQFTPDLLPSDILGVSVYDPAANSFRFQPGPVFTNVLLADEINRASPRTQSALLEAMAETQVTVDGERRPLSDLFFVIATQNPVEFHGTYPLPEAQMDRFAVRLSLGYPDREDEVSLLRPDREAGRLTRVEPVVSRGQILAARDAVSRIRLADDVRRYAVDLVRGTRTWPGVALGASPRASLALARMAQALAAFDGEPFVSPEHIQEIAADVLAHRLVLDRDLEHAGANGVRVVEELLKAIPVPV